MTCLQYDLNVLVHLIIFLWTPLSSVSLIHHLIIFLFPPSWSKYCLFFLLRVHCIAPGCSILQEVWRSIDVTSVKDFANSINALLVWQSFLFGNQLSYFKDNVYSKSNCWNEIRDVFFKKKIKLLRSKIQHMLFNVILWLSCILKKKQKLTRCKNKMAFPIVLYVSFNLWSWVYHLMVCDVVTFCEIQETRCSSQNLSFYRERLFLLLFVVFF